MSVATSTAIIAASAIGAGTSLAGGLIGASATKNAENAQVNAANEIGKQATDAAATATTGVNQATGSANQTLTDAQAKQLALLQPYLAAGTGALDPLKAAIDSEGNPANQFSFTPKDYQNDPEYAFQLQQVEQQQARRAAAGGGLFTGGEDKALARLDVGFTNSTYGDQFQRAIQQYQVNRQNTLNQIAGYQNLVGTGLSSTNTANSDVGNIAFGVAGNTVNAGRYAGDVGLQAAQIRAQALGAKGNAQAAGDIGVANSVNGALGGVTNAVNRYTLGGFNTNGLIADGSVPNPGIPSGGYSVGTPQPPPVVTAPVTTGNSY